jgi:nucleoside-diphosphate-sugar epimerase
VAGDGALLHSYSYAPDVAAGLAALGAKSEALGQVWHLPVAPAESTAQMVERFSRALGQPITLGQLPVMVLKVLGLFSPLIREVPEMTYQWRAPFVLDDSKFRAALPDVKATPLEISVPATVAWARAQYGKARAA